MARVHPIMDALREKRIKRGMTLSKLARVANLSREFDQEARDSKIPVAYGARSLVPGTRLQAHPDRD